MKANGTRGLIIIAIVVVGLGLSGCDDFLTVPNPNAVNAGEIDPVSDARALALSTQQDFKQAWGDFIVEGGWFTGRDSQRRHQRAGKPLGHPRCRPDALE